MYQKLLPLLIALAGCGSDIDDQGPKILMSQASYNNGIFEIHKITLHNSIVTLLFEYRDDSSKKKSHFRLETQIELLAPEGEMDLQKSDPKAIPSIIFTPLSEETAEVANKAQFCGITQFEAQNATELPSDCVASENFTLPFSIPNNKIRFKFFGSQIAAMPVEGSSEKIAAAIYKAGLEFTEEHMTFFIGLGISTYVDEKSGIHFFLSE